MSEPIFEASVRLQADVSDFENQAKASVKRILTDLEQGTAQAIRGSQQRVAQAAQQLQQQAQRVAAPAPQQLKLFDIAPIQPEVLAPVVPPPAEVPPIVITPEVTPPIVPPPAEVPPVVITPEVEQPVVPPVVVPTPPPVVVPVTVELANIAAEISAATSQIEALKKSGEDASRELETVAGRIEEIGKIRQEVPERAFQTLPEAGELAGLEQRAEELQKQIALERELADATRDRLTVASRAARDFRPQEVQPPPQLAQAVERAQTLATQPIDFTIQANTEQFEQQTAAAFAEARQLAQKNADDTARIAEQAARESRDAFEALDTAPNRQAAVATARLKAAVAEQADAAKEAAADFLKQVEGAAFDTSVRPSQELAKLSELAATQAETAGLLGDEAGRAAKELESLQLLSLSKAEGAEFQARDLAAQAAEVEGVDRQILEARTQNLLASAEKLREGADRLAREGATPVAPGAGGETREGGLAAAFRHEIGGRTTGLSGLLSGGLRFGAAGLAISAGFEAVQELQKGLRVTGDEAFTTQGRLRNMAAELTTGNFIGAIRELTAEPEFKLSQGLEAATEAIIAQGKAAHDAVLDEKELLDLRKQGEEPLEQQLAALTALGKVTEDQAEALDQVAENLLTAANNATFLAGAVQDVEVAITRAGSEAAKFGERGGIFGRGAAGVGPIQAGTGTPGAVVGQQTTGIPRPIVTQPFPNEVFQAGTGGQEVANRIRESLNQRIQSERERLQADLRSARIAEEQARANFAAAKKAADGSGQAADEYEKLVAATTRTATAAQAVKDQAARAAEEMQSASDRIANAQVSAIRDPEAQAAAQLALDQAAQAREGNELERARKDFEAKKIDAVALRQAEAEYAEAVAATKITQNQITDAQEAATEAAAASRKSGTEQALENNIAAAALTKRTSDDKTAFDAAIRYWVALRNNAQNIEEREAARAKVRDLFVGRAAALQPEASSGLRQQQLQNQLAAAQLASNIPQQRIAAEAIVKYWEGQVKALEGTQKAQAQASLIAAQGTLKGVEESAIGVEEQKIQNRIQAARLTKGLGDDKRAADLLVEFWEQQVKDARGADRVRKRASLIAAQLSRQGLEEQQSAGGGGFGTVDFLKISQGIFRDFASNLLPTGGPEAARALFPGFTPGLPKGITEIDTSDVAGRAIQIEEDSRDELRAIRRLLEKNGAGATVNVHQTSRAPDPSQFAQARWAHFAFQEAFNG